MGAKLRRNPQTDITRFTDSLTNFTELHDLILQSHSAHSALAIVTATDYNQTVASLEAEGLSVALVRAIPFVAIGMAEIVGELWLTDSLQCIVYDNMLNRFHWILLGSHLYFNLLY